MKQCLVVMLYGAGEANAVEFRLPWRPNDEN
jgi:hypothetical protein